MKASRLTATVLVGVSIVLGYNALAAPLGTAITYQGRLNDGTNAANGSYDLRFILFDTAEFGFPAAPVLTNENVNVVNGLFTVTLDFGTNVFHGAQYWMDIGVRPGASTGSFTLLQPRQLLTATPNAFYAVRAGNAALTNGAVMSSHIASGSIVNSHVAANAIHSTNIMDGTIAPGDLNIPAFAGTFWKTDGNAGTSAAHFLGTTDSQPLQIKANGMRVWRAEDGGFAFSTGAHDGAPNIIGGAPNNFVAPGIVGATIAGGGTTNVTGRALSNEVSSHFGFIGGGVGNSVLTNSTASVIAGGVQNLVSNGYTAGIVAGQENQARGGASFIGAGLRNLIDDMSTDSVIGGGFNNQILQESRTAIIAGGNVNRIQGAMHAVISGGANNSIRSNAAHSAIGGGESNEIETGAGHSTIAGGQLNAVRGNATHSSVGGGYQNIIQTTAFSSTIAGGQENRINHAANMGTISGGASIWIGTNSFGSTIGGGLGNSISNNAFSSTISGGSGNRIGSSSQYGFIGGGTGNNVHTNSPYTTISGGNNNRIRENAWHSTIAGGQFNTNLANSWYAFIAGGNQNAAADAAFAAGTRAKALHSGSFVWGDSTTSDVVSTNANSVTMRAQGGYRLFSSSGAAGVFLGPGQTSWSAISDRKLKKDFAPVDPVAVLDKLATVPVQRWHYQWEDSGVTPHLGPMAQDFKAAFYPGRDETSITTQEIDGVALAAIQGLNHKLEAKETRVRELEKTVSELKELVTKLAADAAR